MPVTLDSDHAHIMIGGHDVIDARCVHCEEWLTGPEVERGELPPGAMTFGECHQLVCGPCLVKLGKQATEAT